MKTVGERIRQARDARNISAERLAEMVGYKTQSGIANLENRATTSGGTKLAKIAKALRVDVQWLLEGPDSDQVPYVKPIAQPPLPAAIVNHAAQPDPVWPFARVHPQRLRDLWQRLNAKQTEDATLDIDIQLEILVEKWERIAEASQKQSTAA